MRIALLVTLLTISSPALAQSPSTAPATTQATGYTQGLSVRVYKMPRVPHRVRKLLPGQMPDAVATIRSLRVGDKAAFGGLDNNIQADVIGQLYVERDGVYEFEAESDDGIEFRLNDAFVLSDRWINGNAPPSTGSATLRAGWNDLRLGYYQGDGGLNFHLRIRPQGEQDFSEIAPSALRVASDAIEQAKASVRTGPTTVPADAPWRAAYTSKGYAEITDDEADRLVDLFEGPTSYSAAARREWISLTRATNYDALPTWQQTMVLSGFMRGWYFGQTSREVPADAERAAYTLAEPEPLEHYEGWRGADRRGFLTTMTVDGNAIQIYTPKVEYSERTDVPRAIAGLPRYLRRLIREVKVEPYGTAREFNGGGTGIWVRMSGPVSLKTLDSVFAHEAGHLLMNRTNCYEPWVKAIGEDALSVSQYGRRNPSEDFADFVRLYVGTNDDAAQIESLRTLFPARMKLLEELLKQVEQ